MGGTREGEGEGEVKVDGMMGGDEEIWTAHCVVDVLNMCKCAMCSGTGSQLNRSRSFPPRRSH